MVNQKRVFKIKDGEAGTGPVVYWMSRDQRAYDNWALTFARQRALERNVPLVVAFCLVPSYLNSPFRHYSFMLEGLKEVEGTLRTFNIPFLLLTGKPQQAIANYIKDVNASLLITDFDPLRIKRQWQQQAALAITIPFYEVDAHNIIPCRIASGKQEFAAYTIRPKIERLINDFADEFPDLLQMPEYPLDVKISGSGNDWDTITSNLKADRSVGATEWFKPGEEEALRVLERFIEGGLAGYGANRNDPLEDAQSDLSPYLHFGQISAQRILLNVRGFAGAGDVSIDDFLDELIVRRELSDNFCLYNENYDNMNGFPEWGRKTLDEHRGDNRQFVYSRTEFEEALTHDPLWNAAQKEMLLKGKMHGYMRMYWAKKILEWSPTPEEALSTAIYLNDKYELDGRDPNGYAGIAWAIGGLHDRAWPERGVFGKIRYMNYNGCKRKFDVAGYINRINSLIV